MATHFFAAFALVTELAKDLKVALPKMESDGLSYDPSHELKRWHPELQAVEDLREKIVALEAEFHGLGFLKSGKLARYEYIAVRLFESLPVSFG